ncbi:MAG: Fic family protein, partial [Saprospiraceae bacterium]|nr:Fic family protein [Saprospiraceae bacterium]
VIEDRLIQHLRTRGKDGLNRLRDRARDISKTLDMVEEFAKLNHIVSAILSTKPAKGLKSPAAIALTLGEPYDSGRIQLFNLLIGFLRRCTFQERMEMHNDYEAYRNMAFWESYFSNFIEGTRFVVEEAEAIIYGGQIIENRTGDSHDILGTFKICGDIHEMKQLPRDENHLVELLRFRHANVLAGRPDKNPGAFKTKANRAGDTLFVTPEQVVGTLKEGFKLMTALEEPLARATYIMFLITEVHPFDDGNGRIARIMMNAELVAGNRTKIIIPTVYRQDYLLNLRMLSRQNKTRGFVRMMDRVHAFSQWLEPKGRESVHEQLKVSNALKESEEASLQFSSLSKSMIPNT